MPNCFPYPGLRPFKKDEGHIFYGRHRHINDLLERLVALNFVFIIGRSGCGKSSLVIPGLLDTLAAGNFPGASRDWKLAYVRPGVSPIETFAGELKKIFAKSNENKTVEYFCDVLYEAGGLYEYFNENPMPENEQLLIVIDQFEEIFSEENKPQQSEFQRLASVITDFVTHPPDRVYFVVTMRSEYIGDCAAFSGLSEVINETNYLVPPLDDRELVEALSAPAEDMGAIFPAELKQRLLDDIKISKKKGFDRGFDMLPLVQHAMLQLWLQACSETNLPPRIDYDAMTVDYNELELSEQHYEDIGELEHALEKHADRIFSFNDSPGSDTLQDITQIVFRRLTLKTSDARLVRSPAFYAELIELCTSTTINQKNERDIKDMLDNVLKVFSDDTCSFLYSSFYKEQERVDIGHEALIRQWKKLTNWANDEADKAETYVKLLERAADHKNRRADLLGDIELSNAREWRRTTRPNTSWAQRYNTGIPAIDLIQVNKFIDTSHKKIKWKWFSLGLVLAVVGFLIIYIGQSEINQNQLSRDWMVLENVEDAPDISTKALLLSELRSSKIHSHRLWKEKAHKKVYEEISKIPNIALSKIYDTVSSVRLLSGGHMITAGSNGEVVKLQLWDINDIGEPLTNLDTESRSVSAITSIDVSSDEKYIASGHNDGSIQVWNIDGGKEPLKIGSHNDAIVLGVAFSPDGAKVASCGTDGAIWLWPVDKEKAPLQVDNIILNSHKKESIMVCSVDFDPNGNRLVTGGDAGQHRFWLLDNHVAQNIQEMTEMNQRQSLFSEVENVFSVAYTADGKNIVSASQYLIWGKTEMEPWKIVASAHRVSSIALGPKGKFIVTGNKHGEVSLFELYKLPDREKNVLWEQGTSIKSIDYDGEYIVSADEDGSLAVWRQDDIPKETESWKDLIRRAQKLVKGQCLTQENRETLLGESEDLASKVFKDCQKSSSESGN